MSLFQVVIEPPEKPGFCGDAIIPNCTPSYGSKGFETVKDIIAAGQERWEHVHRCYRVIKQGLH
jgi:hypothetical protein